MHIEELIVLLDVKDVDRELERILCIAALGRSAGLITCGREAVLHSSYVLHPTHLLASELKR